MLVMAVLHVAVQLGGLALGIEVREEDIMADSVEIYPSTPYLT